MLINMFILAETAAPASAGQPEPVMMWGWMAIMAALFYFAIIRPQRRQQKERKEMMAGLKTGDRVLLGNGIIGMISTIKENIVVVKIAENVKVEALRSSITRVLGEDVDLAKVEQA